MIKKYIIALVILLSVAAITGCEISNSLAGKSDVSRDTATTQNPNGDIPAKERPATKKDTIILEGMQEEHTFTLVDGQELGFTTYIDEDLTAEVKSTNEGDSLFAYSNFAGKVNKDAMAHIFAKPKRADITVAGMVELAKQTVEENGFEIESRREGANRYEFSEEEFGIIKQEEDRNYIMGHVSIFKHGDQPYWLIVQYPEEFEEGFVPRTDKMVKDIMWYDEK